MPDYTQQSAEEEQNTRPNPRLPVGKASGKGQGLDLRTNRRRIPQLATTATQVGITTPPIQTMISDYRESQFSTYLVDASVDF